MAGCRYILLTAADWAEFQALVAARHQEALPACAHAPGERWNADRSEVLVKMHGADKAWRLAHPDLFDDAAEEVLDRGQVAEREALLASPGWAEPDGEMSVEQEEPA